MQRTDSQSRSRTYDDHKTEIQYYFNTFVGRLLQRSHNISTYIAKQ